MKWRVLLDKQLVIIPAHARITFTEKDITAETITFKVQEGAQINVALTFKNFCSLEIFFFLEGRQAQIHLSAVLQTTSKQTQNLVTHQIHTAADTKSQVIIKGIVEQQGVQNYKGTIRLEETSFRANAQQHHKVLLLDESAHATSVPNLQVLHDDVQCGHGSAISSVDPEQLWYCASRGISSHEAQQLIVQSFLA